MKSGSLKTKLIIFLLSFSALAAILARDIFYFLSILLAAVLCIFSEAVIVYLDSKKLAFSESALISGLIVGLVLSSDNPWWIIGLASLFAVVSKYIIRVNTKHVFNPAALGIFLVVLLFGATTQWKGTYLWYALLPLGSYFIIKIRKVDLLLSYFITTLILFGSQAALKNTPLADIFGYLNYFFIFIMLIEPKTTPVKPLGKIIFGAGVALLIFILTETGVKFDAEIISLLLLNLAVPALNKFPIYSGNKITNN